MASNNDSPANAGEKQVRDALGRWRRGVSGNRKGLPKGTRHLATRAAENLLDGEVEAITRKAVDLALSGDTTALRLTLERIAPPRRDRPIFFKLPKMSESADAPKAISAVAHAVAAGELTPSEAGNLVRLIEAFLHAHETTELERRIQILEEQEIGK